MKHMTKTSKIVLLIVAALGLLGFGFVLSATAEDEFGKIELSKEATKVTKDFDESNKEYGRLANVTLKVGGNPYTKQETTMKNLDIVLVLDGSGSMDDDSRLENLKSTATTFINDILDEEGNVHIGIVEFGTGIKQRVNLTSDKNTLTNSINSLTADGGTNLQGGISKANELLRGPGSREDASKLVIILTDGEPTYFYYNNEVYGTGRSDSTVTIKGESRSKCRQQCGGSTSNACFQECRADKNKRPSEAAKESLDELKANYPTADVYAIAFNNDDNVFEKLDAINTPSEANEKPVYKNSKALNGKDLAEQFKEITSSVKNVIATNGVVTDIIPAGFRLTAEQKESFDANENVSYVENSDGTTLTWNVGDITAGEGNEKILSYNVEAKDEYHGSMYTNKTENFESASLKVTVNEDNPYKGYENVLGKETELKFASPVVDIPAITNGDHYNENPSYVGASESTITGTTILANDLDKNLLKENANSKTVLTVEDEIIIIEDENTVHVANNTYQIKDGNKVLGTLIMNSDGTFTFTSEKDVDGEVSFNYYIKTTATRDNEESYVYSKNAKVTLNITKRAKTNVAGTKVWDDANNQDGIRPESIVVVLRANDKEIARQTVTGNSSDEWAFEFTDLYKYDINHENDEDGLIKYTVEEIISGDKYTSTVEGTTITNRHVPEKYNGNGEYTVIKKWNDVNNQDGIRPESITVHLNADGTEQETVTLTKDNNWTYTFKDLPKYNNGKEIVYTVTEDRVEGYETEVNGNTITNTHTPELYNEDGKYTVAKMWNDVNNQDGVRPESITVHFFADGKEIKTVTLTETNNWTYTFENLYKYKDGKEVVYTVTEDKVEGYETEVNGNTITNTHTPELYNEDGKYTVTKMWNDVNNQDGVRPETITVHFFADGKEIKTVILTETNNWTYTFENLYKYKDGKEVVYTVTEDKVEGYETKVNGNTITNTHTPELYNEDGKYTVTKVWDDANNQDGIRPETITVHFFADGKEIETVTLTGENNWTHTFENLPKYKAGKEIVYTVTEDEVEGYETSVNGNTITNTHTPELYNEDGKYTVTKVWDDANNQDGIRPETITVHFFADGKEIETVTLTGENNWTHTFENLPKYKDGKEIVYTVTEDKVEGYETSVNGNTITNTHTPELYNEDGKYTVTKVWDDNNNQDGIRPETITVTLIGKVEETIVSTKSIELTGNGNTWTYTFNNLPKYNAGQEITYSVEENAVEGYEGGVVGNTITNTHTPGTIDISGKKIWEDNNNQDGKRPEKITVRLLADGKEIATKEVTEASNWTYTFANLPEKANGNIITYEVKEDLVKEYETKYNGFDIINTHTPEVIEELSGTKTWDDNNDQDGKRPESITVRLLADGKEVDGQVAEVVADEDGTWTYTFKNLPKYNSGKEITYSVKEDEVDGYTGTVTGMDIVNKHTPITISINGEKVWVDNNNIEGLRPESITVKLLAHGKEVATQTVTANEDGTWTYEFTDLPKYENKEEIAYTVEETPVEHYEMSIDKDNSFIIVNTHNPKNVTITGEKTWIDDNNMYGRPEKITVTLTGKIGNKVIVNETKDVTADDNWTYTFENLPEYREGIKIVYTIDEADVKDYDKSVDGYNITNTYNPETIDISGTKTWLDNEDQDGKRPESITINLLANGQKVATTTATAESNWTFEFKNQVVYANGEKITYTVEEVSVDGYTSEINGFDLTNNHTPATVSYKVKKIWADQDNNDGIRPESITVRLFQDGKEIETVEINDETDWTYSFTDLPKYHDHGIEYKYEIVEDEVKGYVATIKESVSEADENETVVIITNTHENETNEIIINKIWDDSNNEQGKRPNSITVTITGKVDDEVVVTEKIEITEDMDWTYTLNNLNKYLNGKEIKYEIEEKEVEGYVTFYDGFNITNAFKATGEITPPNTGVVITNTEVNNNSILELIIVVLTSIALAFKISKRIENN